MMQRALSCTAAFWLSMVLFASLALSQQRESNVKKQPEQSTTQTSAQTAEDAKQVLAAVR